MSVLVASINITIDGFCSHEEVVADEIHHEFATRLMLEADYLLLGSRTYELFESFWPAAETDRSLPGWMQDFAKSLNEKPKLVSSARLTQVNWQNTELVPTLDTQLVKQLKEKGKLLMFGSPGLLSFLAAEKLVDEFYFSVQPIVAGKGIRLYQKSFDFDKYQLKLEDQQVMPSGVTNLHYVKT